MKRVERDRYGDWIARDRYGREVLEPGFRWCTRSSARAAAKEADLWTDDPSLEALQSKVDALKGANGQWVRGVRVKGRLVEVDQNIALIVQALNLCGLETVASCSGHGHRPGNIALRDGREIFIARDYDEARRIDALFPLDINGAER